MMQRMKIPTIRKKVLLGIAMLFFSTSFALAVAIPSKTRGLTVVHQPTKVVISGVVTDDMGPVTGANIVEKGTTNGTISDLMGEFSLSVAPDAVLVVSFIGYIEQQIPVDGKTTFEIKLLDDLQALEEVVVVGYGVQKKVNMTGAVSSVDIAKMTESRPITSLSAGLAGMAPGVFVNQGSGRPGNDGATIRIRGQGTLNNSDPLVIVDGIVGNMNDVNPQDVESISILKDAASSSIYGSRAANGVILITTKKGKNGTSKISYNGYLSWESIDANLNIVSDYAEYMELMNESYRNSNLAERFSQEKINEWRNAGNSDPVKYPNTNFIDAIFTAGLMNNHTLSASGGSDNIRYLLSGNYVQNEGVMENSAYERITARANIESDVKEWLTLGMNSYGYFAKSEVGTDQIENVFTYGAATTPGMCFRAPDGRYGGMNNPEDDPQAASNNPLRRLNSSKGDIEENKISARFHGAIRPIDGLSVEGSYGYEYTSKYTATQPVFNDLWDLYSDVIQTPGTGRTSVSNSESKWLRHQMDGIIRYNFDVKKLNIEVMVGASQEKYTYKWFTASKQDLIAPELSVINAATADAATTGNQTQWAMNSYFGRINLNWEDRYLLEANLRSDGSSRFSTIRGNRWGYFPSFSGGWRISEEEFMKETFKGNTLKIRASWGALGNNSLGSNKDNDGNYSYQSLYAAQNYIFNNTVAIGFAQTSLSNANLTWESTYVTNIGLDFFFIKNKLNGAFDYFIKKTKGILIDLPAPLVHGTSSIPRQNAAEVRNNGFELNLGWNDKIGKVNYFISGNFSYIKNEVTKFKGDEMSLSGTNMILEGQPINIQYVRVVDRIIQTDSDLALVQEMIANNPNAFNAYGVPAKGDFLYKDLNEDGLVNDEDRTMIGHGTNPPISYGLNFGASWNGIDFSCLLQGISGLKVHYYENYYRPVTRYGNMINKDIADGRWYEGRTDATYPRLLDDSNPKNTHASDFWIQDKSYMRVKNIQLGYSFPKHLTQKILMESLRVYGSIDNAFTITKYKGLDPEVSATNYPTLRHIVFGVNLSF